DERHNGFWGDEPAHLDNWNNHLSLEVDRESCEIQGACDASRDGQRKDRLQNCR
ncbi:unnamed protein product, partial [Closterium sp. Naga37s-1]